MQDRAIEVQPNEKEIHKVYINNIRVEEGKMKSTVTCVNQKEQKIPMDVTNVEVNLPDVLVPEVLKQLNLESEQYPLDSDDEADDLIEKLKAANDKVRSLQDQVNSLNANLESRDKSITELRKTIEANDISLKEKDDEIKRLSTLPEPVITSSPEEKKEEQKEQNKEETKQPKEKGKK